MKRITFDDNKPLSIEYASYIDKSIELLRKNSICLELDSSRQGLINDKELFVKAFNEKNPSQVNIYTEKDGDTQDVNFLLDIDLDYEYFDYLTNILNEIFYDNKKELEYEGLNYDHFFQLKEYDEDPYFTLTPENFENQINNFFYKLINIIDPDYVKEKEMNMLNNNSSEKKEHKKPKL